MNDKLEDQIERERMAGIAACNRLQEKVAALEARCGAKLKILKTALDERTAERDELKTRCAGLERERDALKVSFDGATSGLKLRQRRLDSTLAERDAAIARVEAAEEALRDAFTMFVITQPPELYPADHWSNRASAILAGHAPATPQYTTEGEE